MYISQTEQNNYRRISVHNFSLITLGTLGLKALGNFFTVNKILWQE